MAARTPRKRKQSPGGADGHWSSFGTPLKKLLVDCSVVLSPLQSRNPNRSGALKRSPAPSYTTIKDNTDKENMAASPQKSSVARKLIVSPQVRERGNDDAYVFSSVKSPDSSPKGTVSAKSFYKKASLYVTPIDRKVISESKGRSGPDMSPSAKKSGGKETSKFTRPKKLPIAKKRKSTAPVKKESKAVPKTVRSVVSKNKSSPPLKIKSEALPTPERTETSPEEPTIQKSAILGLTVKPRPKLTLGAAFFATSKRPKLTSGAAFFATSKRPKLTSGAAFFATSKRPHSAPKRLPPLIQFPASSKTSLRSFKESDGPTVKIGATTRDQKVAIGIYQKDNGQPAAPVGEKSESERQNKGANTKVKRNLEEAKTGDHISLQDESSVSVGADSESQILIDADYSVLKSSSKKDSTIYPIFSTPSVTKKKPLDFRGELMSPVCSSSPVIGPPALNKVPKPNKRKDANKMADDQMIIDAGQKHFGPVTCGTCGMIYSASNLEDEAQHVQYHQRLLESIRYVGWKKERVVAEFWDGKILMICPEDPKYALRKAEEVRELVDAELGFQQTILSSPSRTRTYLYVTNDKKIVGCLIAEPIKQGFRVLAEPPSPEAESTNSALERHRAWRCSSEPQPAICGISRIWVFALMRRKSIASRLMDSVRSSYIYGSRLTIDEIAFSDPTPDGKLFASTYCRVPDFLVYNFLS